MPFCDVGAASGKAFTPHVQHSRWCLGTGNYSIWHFASISWMFPSTCYQRLGAQRVGQLCEQVGGIEWFAREQRGMQALQAPEWRDPEKHVLALHNLEVRGHEKWLPAKFSSLQELSLRGRPRPAMVPASCQTLSLMYHVSSLPESPWLPPLQRTPPHAQATMQLCQVSS